MRLPGKARVGRSAYDEKVFMDSRGRRYFYRLWRAERAKAALVVLHALGLHSGRYAWLCEELASAGVTCFAPDLYGHGMSEGTRGGGSLGELLASARTFVQLVRSKCGSRELHLAGHGLGALLALASSDLASGRVIALSPAVELAPFWRSPLKLKLAAALGLRVYLEPSPLYDSGRRDAILEAEVDNLVVRKVPAKLVAEALRLLRSGRKLAESLFVLAERELAGSECYSAFKRLAQRVEAEVLYEPELQEFPFETLVEKLIA